jgi:hypothetical protein
MTIKSNFKFIIDTYSVKEKVQLLKELYKDIAGYGNDDDVELAHINSFEAKVLKALGGAGTINEITELPQYLGGGSRPQTKTETKADIPDVLKPYVQDILGRARTRMEEQEAKGYEEYEGERIAPITAEEKAAQEGLLSLLGTQQPYLEEALTDVRAAGAAPTAGEIQGLMSQYQQAVTDMERRKAGEAYEGVRKAREAKLVGGGGMSGLGSRAAIEMGLGEQAHLQNLADIQTRGSQSAWQDAQNRLAQQRERLRLRAGDVRGLGKDIYGTQVSEIGLGAQVGEQRRQFEQSKLDDLYRRYMEKKQFPDQELAKYSGLVYGMPTGFLANKTSTQTGPKGPSFGKQLLGAGLQLGGAFLGGPGGAMAGKALGGMFGGGGGGMAGVGSGAASNLANWNPNPGWKSGGLVGRGPNTYKMSGGGGLYDILYERYSALQEPDMSVESDTDIFVERKGGGLTNLPVVYRQSGSVGNWWETQPSKTEVYDTEKARQALGPGWGTTFAEERALANIKAGPKPPPPNPLAGQRDPEQIKARAADKAQRLRALEGTLKAPHWMKLLGAGVGAAGEAIGSPSVAVGPGGMPYHVPTLATSLKSRLADVKQQQMAETAEEKARKRKELETEFETEEEIFQYPKTVQDRLIAIRKLGLGARKDQAQINKIMAEIRKLNREAGSQMRTGLFKYLSDTDLKGAREGLKTATLGSGLTEQNIDRLRDLRQGDANLILQDQRLMMHMDKWLSPQDALDRAVKRALDDNRFRKKKRFL